MVNKLSEFELLSFDCIYKFVQVYTSDILYPNIACGVPFDFLFRNFDFTRSILDIHIYGVLLFISKNQISDLIYQITYIIYKISDIIYKILSFCMINRKTTCHIYPIPELSMFNITKSA